ncbi:MAG: hypothetical protein ROO76_00185 [Terriglobia bacterium]|jgi:hypothetical protein|nr:hypothetical protein [Terriglobia bacterium]
MRLAAILFAASVLSLAAVAQTTFSNIEAMSGWHSCSGCANAGGGATYSMTQHIKSPSLNGSSTKFSLGGTTPWSHALFYRNMSTNSTATHFVYDLHYYYKSASGSSGMEFSVSQRKGYKWYRWDTQCSYLNGNWRLWDNKYARWVDTSIPCHRPSPYSWTHVTFEGRRYNGKVLFVSITVNGKKYYVNRSYYPKSMSSSSSRVIIHYQLNGNKYQTDYSTWGNKFKLTYW